MFARSAISKNKTSETYLNYLLDGGVIAVKAAAVNSPSRLGLRIAEGEDVMAIWFDWENRADLEETSRHIGYTLPSTAGIAGRNHLPPIHQMDKHEILEFCKTINVHPAHLVPLKAIPEFSLPTPVLELLIDMARGQGTYTADHIELAKAAIASETKRINSFLYDKSREEKAQSDNGVNPLTLTQIFSDVLDNPVLMKKLVRESIFASVILQQKGNDVLYPLATRVRHVSFCGLEDQHDRLRNRQKGKENLLDAALEAVESEYSKIFNSETSHSRMLLFIADVKDALLEKDIEPRSSTIKDIVDVLKDFDFKGSQLEKAYECFNMLFGDSEIQVASQDFLFELANNVALYFGAEDRLSKTKRRTSRQIDDLPLQEDITKLFEDESFKEGTLFRRLMDNRVIIALANHENRVQPTAAPK